jgi:hypothetical protein
MRAGRVEATRRPCSRHHVMGWPQCGDGGGGMDAVWMPGHVGLMTRLNSESAVWGRRKAAGRCEKKTRRRFGGKSPTATHVSNPLNPHLSQPPPPPASPPLLSRTPDPCLNTWGRESSFTPPEAFKCCWFKCAHVDSSSSPIFFRCVEAGIYPPRGVGGVGGVAVGCSC